MTSSPCQFGEIKRLHMRSCSRASNAICFSKKKGEKKKFFEKLTCLFGAGPLIKYVIVRSSKLSRMFCTNFPLFDYFITKFVILRRGKMRGERVRKGKKLPSRLRLGANRPSEQIENLRNCPCVISGFDNVILIKPQITT